MSVITMLRDFKAHDLKGEFFIANVVVNTDPKRLERVRIYIEELHDADADPETLPWALPVRHSLQGSNSNVGAFGVPLVGSKLIVVYQNGDPHIPMYLGSVVTPDSVKALAETNYPFRFGFIDRNGSQFYVDTQDGSAHVHLFTGTTLDCDNQGNVDITVAKDYTKGVVGNTKITTNGNTTINTGGDTAVNTSGKTNISSVGDTTIETEGAAVVKANGDVTVSTGGDAAVIAQGDLSAMVLGSASVNGVAQVALVSGANISLAAPSISMNSGGSISAPLVPSVAIADASLITANVASGVPYLDGMSALDDDSDNTSVTYPVGGATARDVQMSTQAGVDPNAPPPAVTDTDSTMPPTTTPPGIVDCTAIHALTTFPDTLQLSPNFTLGMLSSHAVLTNFNVNGVTVGSLSTADIVCNLAQLANNVLEPMRTLLGPNMIVTSGLRAVGNGAPSSQHYTGCAADVQVTGYSLDQYWNMAKQVRDTIAYDQFLLEYLGTNPWYHVSFNPSGNRPASDPTKVKTFIKKGVSVSGLQRPTGR